MKSNLTFSARDHDKRDTSSDEEADIDNEDGWDDVEDDDIHETFISLFDDRSFDNLLDMLNYCKAQYSFDLLQLQKQHDLDFIGLAKLVNYVRKQVSQGQKSPDVTSKASFEDDSFLSPVLENDAVLYSLEDVLLNTRSESTNTIEELQENMTALQARFDAYREDVNKYLGYTFQDYESNHAPSSSSLTAKDTPTVAQRTADTAEDVDYFHSYSFNSIHETMLKDKIRTDAYRNFIYDNKDIFHGKTVLDVGCGTGILSMFCARAGAREVIAVDNSDIIDTAREIIRVNGLSDKIRCIKGKIEEIELPTKKVDIIVSEWMGYCLLYESMLDSVIFARDKYLAENGLMVPSHATIRLTSLIDSELRTSHIEFWNDVYGFDMQAMLKRAHEEAVVKVVDPDELGCEGSTLAVLDLHKATVQDLDVEASFQLSSLKRTGLLEGFVLWFDIFFARSREIHVTQLDSTGLASTRTTILTTSPHSHPTHWQQSSCLIENPETKVDADTTIKGTVKFHKRKKRTRALDIDMQWQVNDLAVTSQSWFVD